MSIIIIISSNSISRNSSSSSCDLVRSFGRRVVTELNRQSTKKVDMCHQRKFDFQNRKTSRVSVEWIFMKKGIPPYTTTAVSTSSLRRIIHFIAATIYYRGWSKNKLDYRSPWVIQAPLYIARNFANYLSIFTILSLSKFATELSLKILSHFKHVARLLCEIIYTFSHKVIKVPVIFNITILCTLCVLVIAKRQTWIDNVDNDFVNLIPM